MTPLTKSVEERICEHLAQTLGREQLEYISLREKQPKREAGGQYRRSLTYEEGKKTFEEMFTDDDTAPVIGDRIDYLSSYLEKNLPDVQIKRIDLDSGKIFLRVMDVCRFKLPSDEQFEFWDAAQKILCISPAQLSKYRDGNSVDGCSLQQIADEKGISRRIIKQRYQNLFKEK